MLVFGLGILTIIGGCPVRLRLMSGGQTMYGEETLTGLFGMGVVLTVGLAGAGI